MRRISLSAVAVAVAVGAIAMPASAGVAPPPNFGGSFDDQSTIGFLAVSRDGRMVRVKHVEWDGFKCKQDRFTGDLHDSIKVHKDGTFRSEQQVQGTEIALRATIRGHFTKDLQSASGTLKVSEPCGRNRHWSAAQNAE